MLKVLTPIIALGLFCSLASYSCGKYCQDEFKASHPKHHKQAMMWKNENAAKLASVYNLTPDDVSKPVVLFRKDQIMKTNIALFLILMAFSSAIAYKIGYDAEKEGTSYKAALLQYCLKPGASETLCRNVDLTQYQNYLYVSTYLQRADS